MHNHSIHDILFRNTMIGISYSRIGDESIFIWITFEMPKNIDKTCGKN